MTGFGEALQRFYADVAAALDSNDALANDFCRTHGLFGFGPAPVSDADTPMAPEALRCTALRLALDSFGPERRTAEQVAGRAAAFHAFLIGAPPAESEAPRADDGPMPDPRSTTHAARPWTV